MPHQSQRTQLSQRSRTLQEPEPMEGTSSQDEEEASQNLSEQSRSSKVRLLAQLLLHSSSNEKEGALKDAVAQKRLFLSRREYPHVLREAGKFLQKSFGCMVVHQGNQAHIVREKAVDGNYPDNTMIQAKRGLLSAILMFIFLSKSKKSNVSCITETMLHNFLKSIGVSYSTPDAIFGDVKKLISPSYTAEFIHDGYISFAKSSDKSETQMFTYDWGPRATLICEPKKILNSFCSMLNDPDVDRWEDQMEMAKETQKEKEQILSNSEKYLTGV
ncbi:hypothetical protein Q1695_008766 [Nippostrongylus brasiliensis]|nr:hypothetical protein Q1695_008766 [Nippostrongylus brasiliensis]